MDHDNYSDDYIRTILQDVRTIAVVGASPKTIRPSFGVAKYLIAKGYEVLPVNPGQAGKEIAGALTFGSLAEIDGLVDMVDVFRNPDAVMGVVAECLLMEPLPRVIWMQLDVRNDEAAKLAQNQGIKVVMDRCPKIEYERLMVGSRV